MAHFAAKRKRRYIFIGKWIKPKKGHHLKQFLPFPIGEQGFPLGYPLVDAPVEVVTASPKMKAKKKGPQPMSSPELRTLDNFHARESKFADGYNTDGDLLRKIYLDKKSIDYFARSKIYRFLTGLYANS
jgi:hypothetical protein